MIRSFIIILATAALVAAGGYAVCLAAHVNPHAREMALAAVACVAGSGLALVPLILTRGASQAGVTQAALIATVLHMMLVLIVAGAVIMLKLANGSAFFYWSLAFFWSTLAAVASACVRAVRTAPPAGTSTAAAVSAGAMRGGGAAAATIAQER